MGDVGLKQRRPVAVAAAASVVALVVALLALWFGLLLVAGAAVAASLAGQLWLLSVDFDAEPGEGR